MNWRLSDDEVSGPKRSGTTVHLNKPITSARVKRIEFLDDHSVLTPRDQPGYDYNRGGTVYHPDLSQYHWEEGRKDWIAGGGDLVNATFPISVTRGKKIRARIELEIEPIEATEKACVLVGTPKFKADPQNGYPAFPMFRSAPFNIEPYAGPLDITVETEQKLPNGVIAYENVQFDWGLELADFNFVAGSSRSHNIYVIYGHPWTGTESKETGVTLKRMRIAVRVAHNACMNTFSTFENIDVKKFMKAFSVQCGAFGFSPAPNMTPQYISDTKAVHYIGNAVGGAWPHINYDDAGAECQALTRLAAGMAKQIGLPAWLEKAYIYADPDHDNGQAPIYHAYVDEPTAPLPGEPQLNQSVKKEVSYTDIGKTPKTTKLVCYLNLITMPDPQKGQIYPLDALGANSYEAVLSIKDVNDTFYYAGGAGITAGGDIAFQRDRVLNIFSALVWWAHAKPGWVVIAEIVALYKNKPLL